jgi:hypothetical protein
MADFLEPLCRLRVWRFGLYYFFAFRRVNRAVSLAGEVRLEGGIRTSVLPSKGPASGRVSRKRGVEEASQSFAAQMDAPRFALFEAAGDSARAKSDLFSQALIRVGYRGRCSDPALWLLDDGGTGFQWKPYPMIAH